jgi:microcystin-dependent protein
MSGYFKCNNNTNDSPIGSIVIYPGIQAPDGWIICDGQALSRTTYSNLYSVLQTTFGSGDGSSTFNIPDLRSLFVCGSTNSSSIKGDCSGNSRYLLKNNIGHSHPCTTDSTSHSHRYPTTNDNNGNTSKNQFGQRHYWSQGYPANNNHNSLRDSDRPASYTCSNTSSGGSHYHLGSGTNSNSTGESINSSFTILPPFKAFNYIIKY